MYVTVNNGVTENRRETQNSVQKAEKMSDTDFTTTTTTKTKQNKKTGVKCRRHMCTIYINVYVCRKVLDLFVSHC